MKLKTIIYATDFSECSEAALQYATAFASAEEARLLIVHVDDETPGLVMGDVGYGYVPEIDQIAQRQIDQLEGIRPPAPDVRYEHHFLRGDAAEEINKLAKSTGADLVVVGSHGASGWSQILLGSVAEQIVRGAPCPVLTVRIPQPPSAREGATEESVAKT